PRPPQLARLEALAADRGEPGDVVEMEVRERDPDVPGALHELRLGDEPPHPRPRVEQEDGVALAQGDAGGLAAVVRQPAPAAEDPDVQISTSGAGSASASPVFGVPSRSISRMCASGSARGQCSTPAGTTYRSP